MICSPAEIEKKRLQALQKLERKGVSPIKSVSNTEKNGFSFGRSIKKPYEKPNDSNKTIPLNFHKNTKVVITIGLISQERFNVNISTYYLPVIEEFKLIPSKNYDPNTRMWTFHIKDYDNFIFRMAKLKNQNVVVEPLPHYVVNCLKKQNPVCDIDLSKLDPELSTTLLPFQLEGLRFGIERNGRCLIADDMGLGKTFQALAIMNYYKSDWPLLIVTTASMKNTWEETIYKYMSSVSVLQVQYMVSGKDFIGNSKILIVSHDLMSRYYEKLLERNFGCIIIDESHNLKNYKTKITQAATKLAKKAKRVVLLSGTPALSRPNELHTQLSLIDDRFFGSFMEYAKRYCDLQKTTFGMDSSGKSNLQELDIILQKKFMIRRTKEDVLGSLPKKTQEIVELNVHFERLDEKNRTLLETLARQYSVVKKSVDKHAILLSFFSETAKIKIVPVCSYVCRILDRRKKFLVFAHHLIMLNALEQVLKQNNCGYIRIDGSTAGEQRKYFVDKFQTNENCLCALLSITAANSGITLTAAQLVVFAELHWNPSILSQAEARAHRIGQENPVTIQYLLAPGTADDSIWPMLQDKQTILNEMGLCNSSLKNVAVNDEGQAGKNRTSRSFGNAQTMDLTSYFTRLDQKQEEDTMVKEDDALNDSLDEALNDGFDDVLNEGVEDALNDGLDDILCKIDF